MFARVYHRRWVADGHWQYKRTYRACNMGQGIPVCTISDGWIQVGSRHAAWLPTSLTTTVAHLESGESSGRICLPLAMWVGLTFRAVTSLSPD